MRHPSLARKAGRSLYRALKGLLGEETLTKARDSARALREEYRSGRDGSEAEGEPPRSIPHEVVEPEDPKKGSA